MTAFTFTTDEKSEAFCRAIVDLMMSLFGISEEEAVGRVNRQWNRMTLTGQHVIYHEDEDYWAHTIYYGRNSQWWENRPGLTPVPFP
jgi:hypothetical protein